MAGIRLHFNEITYILNVVLKVCDRESLLKRNASDL
jgi:hypothetical protein